jgi:flagellum-specific ATP synthase
MVKMDSISKKIKNNHLVRRFGEIHNITEQILISKGPICKIGDVCEVGEGQQLCEVISLKGNDVYLMPLSSQLGKLSIGDRVFVRETQVEIPNVQQLLGRVINGLGEFIDTPGDPFGNFERKTILLDRNAPNAMLRKRIDTQLETGVKAIDSMLSIGEGQRIGIFAGTGVGKSTLLGMIAKNAKADINVIALVGERGREVRDFIERDLGEEGMKRSILVVSTSDETPLMT